MTRVLEIFAEPISNGGQESIVMNVLKAMNLTDISVDVVTPYYCDNDYYKNVIKQIGGKLYCWDLPFRPGKSRFFYVKLVREFLTRHQYDVIHIHSGSVSALAYMALAAKQAGVKKVIVHSHASGTENIKHFILKRLMAPIFKVSATDYFACSELAAEFKFRHSIVKKKCIVLKNGIDTELFQFNETVRRELREKYNIDKETTIVGHVGRFSVEKNHVFLIHVFEELLKIKNDCKLMLIGSGDEEKNIVNEAKKLGVFDKIIFVGNVNDVYNYMQAMDVFVQPSLFEGFSIVALEAQGAGLPVVLSDVIPNEVSITDDVHFVSLQEGYDKWAKTIKDCLKTEGLGQKYHRKNTKQLIIDAGCDIHTTAEIVRKVYVGE